MITIFNYKNIFSFLLLSIMSSALIVCTSHTDGQDFITGTQDSIFLNLSTQDVYILIQNNADNPNFIILDVRTPSEYASEYIEGAQNLDFYDASFQEDLDALDKNSIYLVYCRSGNRSGQAVNIMKELNFTEVYNLLGGITQWMNDGYPVITPDTNQ